MQKSLPSRRGVSFVLALSLALGFVLMTPLRLPAESGEQIVTFSGQKIVSSIFEGLLPSRFAPDFVPKQDKSSGFLEEKTLGGYRGARLLRVCDTCPPKTACAGHYEKLVPCYGCCTDPGNCGTVSNFVTNPELAPYDAGEYESYDCGPDCCADSWICSNP